MIQPCRTFRARSWRLTTQAAAFVDLSVVAIIRKVNSIAHLLPPTGRLVPRSNLSFTRSPSATGFCPALPSAMAPSNPEKSKAQEIGLPEIPMELTAALSHVHTDSSIHATP